MYHVFCFMSYNYCLFYVLFLFVMSYAVCLMFYVLCLMSYVLCLMSYVLSPEFQYCLFVRLVSEHIFSWA